MAGKDTIIPIPIIDKGDMSLSSITSKIVKIQGFDNITVQMVFTGVPTGVFTFAVSQDQINWTILPFIPPVVPVASGSPDNITIDFNQLGSAYFQGYYTKTSGSGSLNMLLTAKLI